MKGSLGALLGGVGTAVGIAVVWEIRQGRGEKLEPIRKAGREIASGAREISREATKAARQISKHVKEIDLNSAGRDELLALPGMSDELADRIIENRPYRNKLDLLVRLVIPEDVYEGIKHAVHIAGANEGVKIAP
jgi:DNA uptake protein ComE-like DNA-binding protein